MRHYSMQLVAEGRADGRDVSLNKLDATGVAQHGNNKHNMRHYSRPSSRLVAEMRADGRDVSLRRNACLRARCLSTQHALAVSQSIK